MTLASRPRHLSRLAASAAAALLVLAGCTGLDGTGDEGAGSSGGSAGASDDGGAAAPSATAQAGSALEELGTSAAADLPDDPAQDPAYASYYEQDIEWGACEDVAGQDVRCGTLTVPMVWNDPGAGDVEIAVARTEATGERIGTLVSNPGGPGGSGVNFMESLPFMISPEVSSAYDLVSFDPRGVDRSDGIQCLSDAETDEFLAGATEPGDDAASQFSEQWRPRIAEACQQSSGEILPYLDTFSVARDMDVLRAAVGSEQLDYLGYSYGTYLGASYAELYPDRVGHFVLDGAVDPTLTREEYAAGQAEGFEHATEAFLADCLEQGEGCPFTGSAEEAKQQLLDFFAAVDADPLGTVDPERPLTGALARSAVMMVLYEDGNWPAARDALTSAMSGDGSGLLNLADLSSQRDPEGHYRSNGNFAIAATNCLDRPGAADEAAAQEEAARLTEEFPTFGPMLSRDDCVQWPVPPLREPAPIAAEGAGPIVVIGTTGDPATPYDWAQSLAKQLDDSVLLTFEGEGHTAYGRSGGCIEEQVDAYLVEDTVPEDGLTC